MKSERLTAALPLIFAGLLAIMTFWLDRVAQPPAQGLSANRNDPDYIVEGLSAVSMSETGAAKHTLSASKMVHYPEDDTTLLTTPKFVSYSSAKSPVTITANQAVVSSNGDHVYFQDNVLVTRAPYGNSSELVMRTPFLHVIPDDNVARTDRMVTISDAATTVTAVGLEMNNETRVIKLMSNVQGTYDPKKASPSGTSAR